MTEIVPCTRCGSIKHSRYNVEPSWNTDDGETFHSICHVICVGCDFEWVE